LREAIEDCRTDLELGYLTLKGARRDALAEPLEARKQVMVPRQRRLPRQKRQPPQKKRRWQRRNIPLAIQSITAL